MFTAIHKARRSKGFTLVELLLVIAIIAILAFLAIPRIVSSIRNSREKSCQGNIQMIEEAVNRYIADKVAAGAVSGDEFPWALPASATPAVVAIGGAWGSGIKADFQSYFKAAMACPFDKSKAYQIAFVYIEPDPDATPPVIGGWTGNWGVVCTGATVTGNPPTHP